MKEDILGGVFLVCSIFLCVSIIIWAITGEFDREQIVVTGTIVDIDYLTEYSRPDRTQITLEDGRVFLIKGLVTNYRIGETITLTLEHATRDTSWNIVGDSS